MRDCVTPKRHASSRVEVSNPYTAKSSVALRMNSWRRSSDDSRLRADFAVSNVAPAIACLQPMSHDHALCKALFNETACLCRLNQTHLILFTRVCIQHDI